MEGRDVFKHAVRSMATVCTDILTKNNFSSKDIDLIIPHQANIRIIQALGKNSTFLWTVSSLMWTATETPRQHLSPLPWLKPENRAVSPRELESF